MNEKRVTINGFEMAWSEKGSGETLLLLHGFPLNREMWQPQVDYFADNYRVIAPDLRGFGRSQMTPNKLNSMEQLSDDVVALLDYCEVEQAIVAGLSMGGYVTFALYRKYPQRVKALVLADTKAEGDSPEGRAGRYELAKQVEAVGAKAATEGMLPKLFAPANFEGQKQIVEQISLMIEYTNQATIIATLPGLAERHDSTQLLPFIKIPTLVIHGEEDILMPISAAKAMTAQIPNSQFVAVPEAGHMSNLENPVFFNQAVAQFLQNLS